MAEPIALVPAGGGARGAYEIGALSDRRDRARRLPPPLSRSVAPHRSPQLAFLGRLSDAIHGELLSYLFFAPEFAHALMERGAADAQAWLDEPHDDGLWDTGPLGRHR
jgi:hypothetical protein